MAISRRDKIVTILSMTCISAVFTAAVATVEALTRDGIRANAELREVLGGLDALGVDYSRSQTPAAKAELAKRHLAPETRGGLSFYRGLDAEGRLKGYVFPIGGAGFWGAISGYVAIDPAVDKIIGIAFVRHSETPGLGARITEDKFRKQLVGKAIAPGPDGLAIRLVQDAKKPNEVDAITGATGTSTGVERFLNRDLSTIRRAMKPQG